jgi:hypothetical protein
MLVYITLKVRHALANARKSQRDEKYRSYNITQTKRGFLQTRRICWVNVRLEIEGNMQHPKP